MKLKETCVFLGIVVLFWFAQYVYIPYQTAYLTSVKTAESVVGFVVGAYGISQLILRLPAGLCADRAGRHKPFILLGTAASGAASLFRVFWGNGYGFMAANLLSGFASAMWISFMVFYTEKYPAKERQKATSRIIMFNNLGMLAGFILSTLCYPRIGMGNLCLLSVLAGAAAFVLALGLDEQRAEERKVPSFLELLQVCQNRPLIVFSLLALIQQGIQLTTVMSFTNQILKNCGASDGLLGVSSIIYMVSAVSFSALAFLESDKQRGPIFWIPAVFTILAVYCIGIPLLNNFPKIAVRGILFLQLLPGMATGILFSYTTSEAMKEIPGEKTSTAMGFYQAVYAVGMTLFPIFTGNITVCCGIQTGYFILAGTALAGGIGAKIYYVNQSAKAEHIGQRKK